MSWSYLTGYTPPAPVMEIFFGLPGEALDLGPHIAFVDAGADMAIVPQYLLIAAGIPAVAEAQVRGQWSASRAAHLYLVDLQVAGVRLPDVYVVGNDEGDEIILGRNVLNKLTLLLDGPRQQASVLDELAARRLR